MIYKAPKSQKESGRKVTQEVNIMLGKCKLYI